MVVPEKLVLGWERLVEEVVAVLPVEWAALRLPGNDVMLCVFVHFLYDTSPR